MSIVLRRRTASVRRYLAASFAVCLLGVAGLAAFDSHAAFNRERNRAVSELRSAAQSSAQSWGDGSNSLTSLLAGLADAPGIASGGRAECEGGLIALSSAAKTAS